MCQRGSRCTILSSHLTRNPHSERQIPFGVNLGDVRLQQFPTVDISLKM